MQTWDFALLVSRMGALGQTLINRVHTVALIPAGWVSGLVITLLSQEGRHLGSTGTDPELTALPDTVTMPASFDVDTATLQDALL